MDLLLYLKILSIFERGVSIEKIRGVNFTVGLSISWNSLSYTKLLPRALALCMLILAIPLRSVLNVVI